MRVYLYNLRLTRFLLLLWFASTVPDNVTGYTAPITSYSLTGTPSSSVQLIDIAEAFEALAVNFAESGLVSEASAFNHSSIEIYKSLGKHRKVAENFYRQGITYFNSGNLNEALKYVYAAYRYVELAGLNPLNKAKYLATIAKIYEQ